ncbi:MAG TPA: WbqC family protein [Stellaceae bacterium]|nr:WbqC family protein [Stellaceae bacterium]
MSGGDRKRVAIVQSNYIPWKGYFDLIRSVDEFVLLDSAQYTKGDWRNRNRIMTPRGPSWLTIPVANGPHDRTIEATRIAAPWVPKHWALLTQNYGKAGCFAEIAPYLKALYDGVAGETKLSGVNVAFIAGICRLLGIGTRISWSRDYAADGDKTDRVVAICRALGATHYLSGPSARAYLEIEKFSAHGIAVIYADYSGYPEYPQLHGPFEHRVSIVDLLFNVGREAPRYMKLLCP